ncbi:MAG: cytochrome C oxidase subunit IV family protein [Giesbergeria sp.]|nr:cytochrome C oxidase subunit IV family protein [Giesbergeria sp.]
MPAPPDSARPLAGCTAAAPRPDIAAPPVTVQSGSGRALTLAWLVLLAITATTWGLGGGHLQTASGSMVPVLVLCALTFVKGLLVSLEFLELRHAPALWRWLVCGWLSVVLLLIALAFWVGRW